MPRKKPELPAELASDDVAPDVRFFKAAPPEMVSVTILAEGVRIDGFGAAPVGISVLVTLAHAEALKAEGLAE